MSYGAECYRHSSWIFVTNVEKFIQECSNMRKISIFFFFSYQKLGVRLIHVCAVYTRLYGTCSCGGPQKIIFLFFPHFWSLRWLFMHHRLCRFHLITLWKTYSFQGRCPWTPQGALPLDPARGAAPRTPPGRCPSDPAGALPLDPAGGAAPRPPASCNHL